MPRTASAPDEPLALRDACIVAAQQVIAERGVEGLSLREVSRKLGVSHQAPYRHYASRELLLAEVMRRCFGGFAAFLDARPRFDEPERDLESLGHRYLAYAAQHPLEYRLMFGTSWPASDPTPPWAADALHAYELLRDVLRRLHGRGAAQRRTVELDALHIWSTMHGLAGVLNGPCLDLLDLSASVRQRAVEHAMERLSLALAASTGA
jgi:AcrR family transcriptional regulator